MVDQGGALIHGKKVWGGGSCSAVKHSTLFRKLFVPGHAVYCGSIFIDIILLTKSKC